MMTKRKFPASEEPFISALRARFGLGEYIILTQVEVPAGAGFRRADVLVLGKWASRDLSIHGFEIKASRQNWLNELRNPEKAEVGSAYCDNWSLIAYPGVADPNEVPAAWGHWTVEDGIAVQVKAAPILHPRPIDRVFVARLLESFINQVANNIEAISKQEEYDRGFSGGKAEGYDQAERSQGYLLNRSIAQGVEIERLEGRLRAFRLDRLTDDDASALKQTIEFCRTFRGRSFQEAMKIVGLLSAEGIDSLADRLKNLYVEASNIKLAIEDRLDALKKSQEGAGQ